MFNPFKAETAPIRHLVKSGSDLVGAVIVRFVHGFLLLPILVLSQFSGKMFVDIKLARPKNGCKTCISDNQMVFVLGPNVVSFE